MLIGQDNVNPHLFKKSGITLSALARDFYLLNEGDRIPTIHDYVDMLNVSRRTIQDGVEYLISIDAIQLERHGCKGSTLASKNNSQLYGFTNWGAITGIMPLPATDALKGLATAIYKELSSEEQFYFSFSFVFGSEKRVEHMKRQGGAFCLTSRSAARVLLDKDPDLELAITLSDCQYSPPFVLAFRTGSSTELAPGLRLGFDSQSTDHIALTGHLTQQFDLLPHDFPINHLIKAVKNGEVDVAILRKEPELMDDEALFCSDISPDICDQGESGTAVILTDRRDYRFSDLLSKHINIEQVRKIQDDILKDRMEPFFR